MRTLLTAIVLTTVLAEDTDENPEATEEGESPIDYKGTIFRR